MDAFADSAFTLLRYESTWAGINVSAGADFTTQIISRILTTMLARLNALAIHAVNSINNNNITMPMLLAGGWLLVDSIQL